jgi:hypothetical protein
MTHETTDQRRQQRCFKDIGMTCAHLNENDDHIVTVRNYSNRGVYFESDEAARIGSFVVIRAVASHDVGGFASPSDSTFQFTIEPSDPEACRGYRSHTVAKVIRCNKVDDDTKRFGVGAEILMLSD